jgi:hypothetical protein
MSGGRAYEGYCVAVNGKVDRHSYGSTGIREGRVHASFRSKAVAKPVMDASLLELDRFFDHIELPYQVDWNQYFNSITIDFGAYPYKKFPSIDIELHPDWERWARPYSMIEYAETLERVIKSRKKSGVSFFQSDELISNGFGLRSRFRISKQPLKHEIETRVKEFKEICDEAEKRLVTSARQNSVTTFFTFPIEIRTACEQYLLYFVQFLDDLGIKADAEIKEHAQKVLFSVTPKEGVTALKQVREALDVYLRMPTMNDLAVMNVPSNDIALQQLQANVLHLRSQLMLANTTLAAKDATIEALQVSNYQYRQLLASDSAKAPEHEPLIGDAVHVTPVESKGIRIDLPLILRKLKRRFGSKENRGSETPRLKQGD